MLSDLPSVQSHAVIALIEELNNLPQSWALTPVRGDKRPYRTAWNTEIPLERNNLIAEINAGAKGYGIRTGCISEGILAIDADGYAAEELLQKISQGDLPETVTFTSGKPGRCQRLFVVPPEYWDKIKTLKLNAGSLDGGKKQLLEFRWDNCQSVLPPSEHPETGKYFWIRSPENTAVAQCPQRLIEFLVNYQPPDLTSVEQRQTPPKKVTFFDFLPSVTVHAALADPGNWITKNHKGQVSGHSAIKFRYFLEANDIQGSGNLTLDLRLAAIAFERSVYTIRRWIKFGLAMGILRSCRRVGTKTYRIFYTSLAKICQRYNLADLGACVEVEACDLNQAKFIVTEATAEQLQKQSRWHEKEHKRKNLKKCVPSPEVLTTSDLGSGAILCKQGRFTFLKSYAHPHGGSQKRIAWELGRHPSTVQRRLANGYRQDHDLKPIPKTQLLTAPKREMDGSGIKKLVPGQKLWRLSFGLFKLGCNVYDTQRELIPKRYCRRRVKRAIESVDDNWKSNPEYQTLKQAWKQALH